MSSYKFSAYRLDGLRDKDTNERNFTRVEMKQDTISLLGHRCIQRTLHQIATRLPKPSVQMGKALLLDPRMKKVAKNYLRTCSTPDTLTDSIFAETKEQLYRKHRIFYRAMRGSDTQDIHHGSLPVPSPSRDIPMTFDGDFDLLCGDEVSQQSGLNPAEEECSQEADAEVERWFAHRIEWTEVVKLQISDEVMCNEVLGKLTMLNRDKKSVWNVEQLCQHIDVCKWFANCGEQAFPSVAKLARVWLGRSCSTAFQERVFSTGSFVMSSLRTRTDNERAHRQVVLRHNRAENERMEASKRGMW
ncbi:unnamed protein product [Phytophthora fragariaefolia]|uniref:Unnamed protein product n=1 Tax=Phytophthora fragariaefolia TaxID=1490495 RepID=A0A9W6TJT3_9STRA|nr:unnamed protein product [Phytophthora fragariaefolia]